MLKELEDFKWFPTILRRWQMDFIGSMVIWAKLYKPVMPKVAEMLSDNKIAYWQDVCSGSGIPAVYIHQQLTTIVQLTLTDMYPHKTFVNQPNIHYLLKETDALRLHPASNTFYTMFNAFHHFSPLEQIDIIKKMAVAKAPFMIVEILEPGFFNCIKIFFTTILLQLLTAPFIKPFSVARLFFTYIIPVNLFTISYDGIISVLKSKTAANYQKQMGHIIAEGYCISVLRIKNVKGNITYIKGVPVY